jgi:hypothetical protein
VKTLSYFSLIRLMIYNVSNAIRRHTTYYDTDLIDGGEPAGMVTPRPWLDAWRKIMIIINTTTRQGNTKTKARGMDTVRSFIRRRKKDNLGVKRAFDLRASPCCEGRTAVGWSCF